MLLDMLKLKAVEKGLMKLTEEIDAEKAFLLVRDMPYKRASSRQPETTIREWQGTCSGKHYLLQQLFAELGYASRLMACTAVTHIDLQAANDPLKTILEQSQGRFVDVHNYLILALSDGDMIVDATWPLVTQGLGTVVNETFVLGEDQQIACEPIETWTVPEGQDPQAFKEQVLQESFSEEELKHRETFIQILSDLTSNG